MVSTPGTSTPTLAPTHPAHTLLARAHSPDTASRIFTEKVRNKPLLLQPTTSTDKRALRRQVRLRKKEYYLRKQKPRPLSAKEKRQTGVHDLKPEEIKYDIYKGLNEMWNGYMLEVLGYTNNGEVSKVQIQRGTTAQGHGPLLASADFHGAEIEVVRSKDAGKIGIKGIVVRDTKSTFVVVTEKNELKTLPKKAAIFRYKVWLPTTNDSGQSRTVVLELHGSQFEKRPAERASRQFKWQSMNDL